MTLAYDTHQTDPVLSTLPEELVAGLPLSRHRLATIDRGRSIIASGQTLDAVYLIAEGWAVSKLSIETGDTQILDILGPGSIAGITRLTSLNQDDYAAIALQNVRAYRIEIDQLQALCAQDEKLSQWLNRALSHQSQRMQRHITALGQLPARGRLAFAMLRIVEVARQAGVSGVDETIRLPMTQEEIGNMLGLTNVSISKLMSAFRKEGLIDYGRNRIIVRDIDALSEICGMSLDPVD
ncbi:Crp/Fnr family transcriptional regulator [Algimonas porphyrae]|uniref:cAMP-binding protein n=1 Tax=Algimonas porphyrae TaxID=1128113 RepID=A0ABQ5UZW5_9PROT|nr:Crp/Fnr family transcriptional regulator [Algimonas porphyrae]GLQ20454.1 cAMP-binding protein [Algimonas porphyrae]